MKKGLFVFLAAALCVSACSAGGKQEELSDEEVVCTMLEAFKAGDYAGIQPYIDADNPLHLFFSNADGETGGELAPAYQSALEKLKDVTYTAEAVEGKEAWGAVNVTIAMPDYSGALYTAMVNALTDQVNTGSSAFHDLPVWLAQGVQGEGERIEETFELSVGNRDGSMVMDSNVNRKFFAMLCGGLKPYLDASMTTCTFPDGTVCQLLSLGDEIEGMINMETVEGISGYPQEDIDTLIQEFEAAFQGIDGITAHAETAGDVLSARWGVDMETASSYALNNLGIINDRITAGSNGWLSLDSTISGFTRQGASCVTENFKT